MRKRTSPIWTTPKEELENIVKNNSCFSEILRDIGLDPYGSGSRYISLKKRLNTDEIDFSHIDLGAFSRKGKKFIKEKIPLEKIMIENSTYNRCHLKRRLLEKNILENKCEICGQNGTWNNKKLVMTLDHKNGKRNDHRRENLQMLCPNCNSQQKTFAGKRNRKSPIMCKKCNVEEVSRRSKTKLCRKCYNE